MNQGLWHGGQSVYLWAVVVPVYDLAAVGGGGYCRGQVRLNSKP